MGFDLELSHHFCEILRSDLGLEPFRNYFASCLVDIRYHAQIYAGNISNWILLFIAQFISTAPIPTVSFIFEGTQFGYFTLPPESIDWVDSETSCIAWNGHLATIRSQQEDTLLLHSTLNIDNVECFIGLNDRENDAGTNASAFVWVDGSDSTYRQFETNLGITFPVGVNDGDDCGRFRYVINNMISNGWFNRGCDDMKSCYFCNRPGK